MQISSAMDIDPIGNPNTMWQRHGIASCSAALKSKFAVGAAHFDTLPSGPDVSPLAAKNVPPSRLHEGHNRTAHNWDSGDSFLWPCEEPSVLVCLFSS
jgi:hypothetical protein